MAIKRDAPRRHLLKDIHIDCLEFVTLLCLVNLMYSLETLMSVKQDETILHGMCRILGYSGWMTLLGTLIATQIAAIFLNLKQVRQTLCFIIAIILGWSSLLIYHVSQEGLTWRYQAIFSILAIFAYVRLSRKLHI